MFHKTFLRHPWHSKGRLTNFILVLLLSALLASCELANSLNQDSPKHVALLLFGDSRLPQADGFVEGLKELGYEDGKNVRFSFHNAANDRSKLEPMIHELMETGIDMLVPCGGLESDAARKLLEHSDIPVINAYNASIVERGLVNSRRNPGWNITGIDSLSAELSGKRVELIRDMLPGVKRILLLYHDSIAPSRIGREYAAKEGAKFGITIDARQVISRSEIEAVMTGLKPGDVDAMLLVPIAPVDGALDEIVLPNAGRLKLPVFGHSRAQARAGVLASYGASFFQGGKQAARLADKVLRGVPASSIPFETPKQFEYILNRSVLARLGITLTDLAESEINEYL